MDGLGGAGDPPRHSCQIHFDWHANHLGKHAAHLLLHRRRRAFSDEKPLLWQASLLISHLGETVVPLINKYATRMEPPLSPRDLCKTQAVMTLFLLAGAVIAIPLIPYIVLMPRKDVRFLEKMQGLTTGNRWLLRHPLINVPFAILAGFAVFLGWGQFDPDPAYFTWKKCLLEAACYTQDDLWLITTGYLTIFGSYGFWLASLMFVILASEAEPD